MFQCFSIDQEKWKIQYVDNRSYLVIEERDLLAIIDFLSSEEGPIPVRAREES